MTALRFATARLSVPPVSVAVCSSQWLAPTLTSLSAPLWPGGQDLPVCVWLAKHEIETTCATAMQIAEHAGQKDALAKVGAA